MMAKFYIFTIETIVKVFVVFLFILTLQDVEPRLTDANILCLNGILVASVLIITAIIWSTFHFHWSVYDTLVSLFICYYYGNAFVGQDQANESILIKALILVLLYGILRFLFSNYKPSDSWIIILIVICGFFETVRGLWQLFVGQSNHSLYPITGNFQNPGPYSAYLMMAAVLLFVLYRKLPKNDGNFLHVTIVSTALSFILLVLALVFSRAAFIGLAVIVLLLYRHQYAKYKYVLLAAIISVAIIFFILKQGSAEGRLTIWASALVAWLHYPFFGAGIGSIQNACAEGLIELFKTHPDMLFLRSAGVADSGYNIFIEVLTEMGLVGFVFFLTIVAYPLYKLRKQSIPLFYMLLSLLVFSLFSYPFSQFPYQIISICILAWSSTDENVIGNQKHVYSAKFLRILFCVIIILVASTLKSAINLRMEADEYYNQIALIKHPAFIKDYYRIYSLETDNPNYLFNFGNVLREGKRYRDSNAILRQGAKVSSDPMFWILMGRNYEDEGFYAEAEHAYQHAFMMMPNRIYPLYRQMELYTKSGQKSKAKAMAGEILNFKEKIVSSATKMMKDEALNIQKGK